MLVYNPNKRISCKDALNHKYFTNDINFLEKNSISSQISNLQNVNINKDIFKDMITSSKEDNSSKKLQLNEDNIECDFHEYSSKNKKKVNTVIKKEWINEDYYCKNNKLKNILFYNSLN